ncbi:MULTISPECIES: iron chelate uptake ABC transporter family permease subunit [Alphaproteobacteria]|uniref:iron chelate uptake ABC transporter family permease subunit n=1 Tax=Alphaproteobacteria TaxID=28211 RepID=UPI003266CE7B
MTGRSMRLLLLVAFPLLAVFYVLAGSDFDTAYIIPRRLAKLAAMMVGGIAVAVSSIMFQTIAGNRILTPAVMGYESVYLLLQSLLLLFIGTASLHLLGEIGNYAVSILFMLGYSFLLHRWILGHAHRDIYFPLLVGLLLTMVIGTFTHFIQLKISPGEFAIFQGFALASFEGISPMRLAFSAVFTGAVCVLVWKTLPYLDVIALGREQATSLGVDYQRHVRFLLALIAILVAVSTSLLGPTAFMGIFVANTAYLLAGNFRHRVLLPLGSVVAAVMFMVAQLMVEHVFNYKTTIGILVNLACGAWFLVLVARPRTDL